MSKISKTKKAPKADVSEKLVSCLGELYLYDRNSFQFVLQNSNVKITILHIGNWEFWISVEHQEETILSQPIDNSLNPVFSKEFHSFIWVYHDDESDESFSWSFRFKNENDEKMFSETFGRCLYETVTKEKFEKGVKNEDRNYLLDSYVEDVEMKDVFEDKEEQSESDEESEENENVSTGKTPFSDDKDDKKNSQLAVGYKHDRSFVVRGNKIGVFKNEPDALEFSTTINNVSTPKGKNFSPTKIMLHDQDASLILLNPENPNSLFQMDLEYGKVVQEWQIDENREIKDFTSDTKYSQMTPQKTFVGLSHNALFRIDPRLSGKKLVDSQLNQYKSKNEFSCTTTTGSGDLIVASDKGDIRLYDKIDKRAKTLLPGYGDPVIGIDVTEDGKYILSTCKNYLLVMETETKDHVSGFQKSMGSQKPIPKRLQLRPEHVAWMNCSISFTPARFNTGTDQEKTIVTSTGPYVITWNFRRVKAGKVDDYSIKKYPERVVADNFRFGTDKNVIVALPDDVHMASNKQFQSPLKVLSTPNKSLRTRDSVVNSPF